MILSDLFQETYVALAANKARSGLTTLGIVIGIASVVAMISIGQGASGSIQASIQSIGSNLVLVQPGFQRGAGAGPVSAGRGSATTLKQADADAIQKEITPAVAVAPEISRRALAGYAHVLNKEVKGAKAVADTAATAYKALEGQEGVDPDLLEDAKGMAEFWGKYSSASTRGGWAALGLAGVAFFLIIASFLRGTGMAWGFGLLGVAGGGVLIALTPFFELTAPGLGLAPPENAFIALFVQPQHILAVLTGGLGLLTLLAVGAGTLGRRGRTLD